MFSTIRVLLAASDHEIRQQVCRSLEALGFNARSVPDIGSALDQFNEYDILILDLNIVNGDSAVVLERWVKRSGNPVLVLAKDTVKDDNMLVCGAWNCMIHPFRLEVLQTLLVRYGQVVITRRKMEQLSAEVETLRKKVISLTRRLYLFGIGMIVAAFLGPQIIPPLLKLIGGA